MFALVVLAVSLACANGYTAYTYPGYAAAAYPYEAHHAGYTGIINGVAYDHHPYVAAPAEVKEVEVEAAPAAYYPHAAPAAYYAAAPAAYAAAPAAYAAPVEHAYSPYAHVPTYASQYHSQDEYGQASYGHAQPGQAHAAVRDHYGNVAGSYYYINPEGKRIEVSYTAGADGFKVHSNDLPVAPVADLELPVAPVYTGVAPVDTGVAPEPVQDTPEVAAAKAAHLEAVAKAAEAATEEEEEIEEPEGSGE